MHVWLLRAVLFFAAFVGIVLQSGCALTHRATRPSNESPLHVELTTLLGDVDSFAVGDVVSFLVSVDRDAFITMYLEDANHAWSRLYPVANDSNASVAVVAGEYNVVPGAGQSFLVSAPFGSETVWLFAATQPFSELPRSVSAAASIDEALVPRLAHEHAARCACGYGETTLPLMTLPSTLLLPEVGAR